MSDDNEQLRAELARVTAERDEVRAELLRRTAECDEVRARGRELRREVEALKVERDALRTIVEGRTTLPSDAEALAHDEAHGQWLVVSLSGHGSTVIDVCGLSVVSLDPSRVLRVYAIDAERRLCAWPGVEVSRG